MIFTGVTKTENIYFHDDHARETHFIEMERGEEAGVFTVRACCEDEWEWRFYDTMDNYEIIKHIIFDVAIGACCIRGLLDGLDEAFEEMCSHLVAWECEATCDCETGCNNCNCNKED